MDVTRQLVSVLVVLVLVVAFAWFMRRPMRLMRPQLFGAKQASAVRVLHRVALTPQHSLHVVDLGGSTVVLGAGPTGITVLRDLGTKPPETPGAGTLT